MDVQGLIVIVLALVAAGYLGWRMLRPFLRSQSSSACGGCCGCDAKAAFGQKACGDGKPPLDSAPARLIRRPPAA